MLRFSTGQPEYLSIAYNRWARTGFLHSDYLLQALRNCKQKRSELRSSAMRETTLSANKGGLKSLVSFHGVIENIQVKHMYLFLVFQASFLYDSS